VTRWRKAAPSTPAPYRKSPRTAEQDSNRRSLSRRSRPLFGRDSWGIPGQSNGGSLKKALFLLGGPRVRILLPPALSHVRTRLPRSVGRLASTCGYHCPLGGSGLPGCGCPYAGHLGCFPSGSIGAARSLQVMIFVIRFLLFVARPRRSGPFLRSPGVIVVRERPVGGPKRLKIRRKREKASPLRGTGGTADRASRVWSGRIERRRTALGFA